MAREIKGQIIRETEKYIYTVEVIDTPRTYFHVKFTRGYCCTVYNTRETAEANGEYLARLFNAKYDGVIEQHDTHTECKYHRYKK